MADKRTRISEFYLRQAETISKLALSSQDSAIAAKLNRIAAEYVDLANGAAAVELRNGDDPEDGTN